MTARELPASLDGSRHTTPRFPSHALNQMGNKTAIEAGVWPLIPIKFQVDDIVLSLLANGLSKNCSPELGRCIPWSPDNIGQSSHPKAGVAASDCARPLHGGAEEAGAEASAFSVIRCPNVGVT